MSVAETGLQAHPDVDEIKYITLALRYFRIYVTAGLMNENALTQEEALAQVKPFEGQFMLTPWHPIHKDCYNNCTILDPDEPNTFWTTAANRLKTQIFSFEKVILSEKLEETEAELDGQGISFLARLDSITVEGVSLLRFRMVLSDGRYALKNPKKE